MKTQDNDTRFNDVLTVMLSLLVLLVTIAGATYAVVNETPNGHPSSAYTWYDVNGDEIKECISPESPFYHLDSTCVK